MNVFLIRVMKFNVFSVINRAPELKLVVETLMSSLKPIGNVVLIAATFFTIFGILGVQVRFTREYVFFICLFVDLVDANVYLCSYSKANFIRVTMRNLPSK